MISTVQVIFDQAIDAASLMWMELVMFGGAALCYIIFSKGLVLSARTKKLGDSRSLSDVNSTGKELLAHLAKGDYRSAVRLWQRVKSLDRAPAVPLLGVIGAMRMLGWPTSSIVEEMRSAMDCNPALSDCVAEALRASGKDGLEDPKLIGGIIQLLEEHGIAVENQGYLRLLSAQLRQKDFDGLVKTAKKLGPGVQLPVRVR